MQTTPTLPARGADQVPSPRSGFSFVEVLAAVAIIGVITFLAIPNLIQIKKDGEDRLAVARAEALNMAMASYVQAKGSKPAAWSYDLVKPYLAFAPSNFSDFVPSGYAMSFAAGSNLSKVTLTYASSTNSVPGYGQ